MIENTVSYEKLLKNANSVFKDLSEDEPLVVIDKDKPEYVLMTFDLYEKLIGSVKVLNSKLLEN
ncbi:MAG TPA: hypothetical protein PKY81_06485 [bacterium]|nr:hypothetical protein [bacterium]HPN30588.1 hypothetical protein [bacterium]